jgi:hypothetical protein
LDTERPAGIGRRILKGLLLGSVLLATAACALLGLFAWALRGEVTTGQQAWERCKVRALDSVMPGGTLVSAVCSEEAGFGTGVRLYVHVKASPGVTLAGGRALPYPQPGTQAAADQRAGICGLLVDDTAEEREQLREFLRGQGMQPPPPDATYATWNVQEPIIGWGEGAGYAHSTVEVLRTGDDVWITVARCGLS